jgi:hypothetical protein
VSLYDDDPIVARFLLSDVELALTFTEMAAQRKDRNTVMRTIQNARRAYDRIFLMQSTTRMADEDVAELNSKMSLLKARLAALGEQFN